MAPPTGSTGLIIGKFLPPHLGHHHLIATARQQVDGLTIVVFARSDEPIPFELRRAWLEELHPGVRIAGGIDDHAVDFHDDTTWRYWIGAIRDALEASGATRQPDLVFSSEDYGAELAYRLGSRHVLVDLERSTHAVSGSLVREDPYAAWDHLPEPVRAWFAKRVAIIGPESTGKTTLAEALALRFATEWVPEYGRTYCEERGLEAPWTSDEFTVIARRQREWEDAAARRANRVVICDTDVLATSVWHEFYMGGTRSEAVAALIRPVDLYLLTVPDVPWVDDGLRDGAHARDWMTDRFRAELDARNARYAVISGSWAEREALAVELVESVLAESWEGATYVAEEKGQTRRV